MGVYYKNLVLECRGKVYEPAEDSFLLADNLQVHKKDRVLDVGCGCGIIALAAAKQASFVLGVDVDPEAVSVAGDNARRNAISNVEFRASDLFKNVSGTFDLIAFNPPYLPSEDGNVKDLAVDGGFAGRTLIEAFLSNAGEHLSPGGRIQVVVSSLNNTGYVKKLYTKNGFKPEVTAGKKLFFEKLYVLTGTRE